MKRKIAMIFIALLLIFTNLNVAYAAYYNDTINHWAESDIDWATENGYLKGDGDGNFRPDDLVTKAEYVTGINRFFKSTSKSQISFGDVKVEDWYYNEVAKGVFNKIIDDSTGDFKPEQPITRDEAAKIVARAFRLEGRAENSTIFKDYNSIANKGEVGVLVSKKVISGYPDGNYYPSRTLTRAEFAKILRASVEEILLPNKPTQSSTNVGFWSWYYFPELKPVEPKPEESKPEDSKPQVLQPEKPKPQTPKVKKYTVEFVVDGETITTKEVEKNGFVLNVENPELEEGFIFVGWYEDEELTEKFDFNSPIIKNTIIYGKIVRVYKITVNLIGENGEEVSDALIIIKDSSGNEVDSLMVENGDYFITVESEDYKTETVEVTVEDSDKTVDINLKKLKEFVVEFDSGYDNVIYDNQIIKEGRKAKDPIDPETPLGYELTGWFKDKEFTQKFDFDTPITENLKLYANFREQTLVDALRNLVYDFKLELETYVVTDNPEGLESGTKYISVADKAVMDEFVNTNWENLKDLEFDSEKDATIYYLGLYKEFGELRDKYVKIVE